MTRDNQVFGTASSKVDLERKLFLKYCLLWRFLMPNIKSAEKRVRQSKKRYIRNKAWKEKVKSIRKEIIKYVSTGNASIEELKKKWKEYQSLVDKTKTKNVFKPNKVNRLKSRLLTSIGKHGIDITKIA